jgi:HlyD family secretion protein
MDRELDRSFRRRRTGRRVIWAAAGVGLVAAVLILLPGWLRPSIRRDQLRTARVERGPVEGVVEASGTVIPAFEGVLSSPIEARVEKILERPGQVVHPGDPILVLDTTASRLDLEKVEADLAKKLNEQQQLRLRLDRSLRDLRGRIETQQLDAEALQYRAEQNRKLRADGLVSEQTLRASEVEARKAQIQLAQLRESVVDERRSTDAQIEGVELDLRTLRQERDEARRQLELATTRSDRAGVLTWTVPQEGATVRRGDVIARIADLASYRVEATVSDVHSSRLSAGLPVRVLIDDRPLSGRLTGVYPTIENGAVKFVVDLDDPRDPKLRNNLRVDVMVVTERRADALRVRTGSRTGSNAADAAGERQVFVVEGDRAVRRTVRFGLAGDQYEEVLDGLREGDEIVLSDLRDEMDLEQLQIR